MSLLGNVFDFAKDSVGELASHPLQTMGAALGVPGYDPFFGGLLNNKPGGALLSPTGNFSSSAWQDMNNKDPNSAGLGMFSGINAVADKIAPMVAGYYAAPGIGAAFGSTGGGAAGAGADVAAGAAAPVGSGVGAGLGSPTAGMAGAGMGTGTWGGAAASPVVGSGTAGLFSPGAGAGGLTGMFSGPAALGDAGLTGAVSAGGSGLGGAMGDMGGALGSSPTGMFSGMLPGGGMSGTASGALGGGLSGNVAGAAPMGGASMGGLNFNANSALNQGQRIMQMRNQMQQQQQQPQVMAQTPNFGQNRAGGQQRQAGPIGPSMSYASFNGATNPFGFGSAYGSV